MDELVSNMEVFQNVGEWLVALGEYWSAETDRWKVAMNRRLATFNPMVKVSIMVYSDGEPRQTRPNSPSDFKNMVDNDRFEIFRNTTITEANRL